jgi:hypothetical protein
LGVLDSPELKGEKMAKLLVIDKCCFQGASEARLIEFGGKYQVFLPHALVIECLISDDCDGRKPCKNPIYLLHRVEALVKAGAYFGRSSVSIHKEEQKNRRAVVQFIDEKATLLIRAGTSVLTEEFVCREAEECRKAFDPLVKLVSDLALVFVEAIKEKAMSKGFQKEIQETCTVQRFGRNLQAADQKKDEILQKWIPSLASDVTEDWYTWQLIRLWYAWAIEWAGRRPNTDDTTLQPDLSNDFYDMEYVASLSRADAIITKEGEKKGLVPHLARAAFPEKDVFSSLEEVPKSYRRDWVDR